MLILLKVVLYRCVVRMRTEYDTRLVAAGIGGIVTCCDMQGLRTTCPPNEFKSPVDEIQQLCLC